jgi:high-affinity iron transporter
MLATAIIVFREALEAALVISIVLAATKGVARHGLWVGGGTLLGLAGAGLVAGFADGLSSLASGTGQEIFNAAVLFSAVAMLGWHNVWMTRHGREIAREMKSVGHDVSVGAKPLSALALVVGLAVLREGSETVLFLYGVATADAGGWRHMLAGGALGLAGGAAVAIGIYFGLLRVPARHLFSVTGWLILLLAAGMASQGAAFLVQGDLLPALRDPIWDTSAILSDPSLVGQVLHVLAGYTARPYGIQVLFYFLTLCGIGVLMWTFGRSTPAPPMRGTARAG